MFAVSFWHLKQRLVDPRSVTNGEMQTETFSHPSSFGNTVLSEQEAFVENVSSRTTNLELYRTLGQQRRCMVEAASLPYLSLVDRSRD